MLRYELKAKGQATNIRFACRKTAKKEAAKMNLAERLKGSKTIWVARDRWTKENI